MEFEDKSHDAELLPWTAPSLPGHYFSPGGRLVYKFTHKLQNLYILNTVKVFVHHVGFGGYSPKKPDRPLLFTRFDGDRKCYIWWQIMPGFRKFILSQPGIIWWCQFAHSGINVINRSEEATQRWVVILRKYPIYLCVCVCFMTCNCILMEKIATFWLSLTFPPVFSHFPSPWSARRVACRTVVSHSS